MRRARRTDRNHAEIRSIFRSLCPAVEDTSDVGRGFPDLLIKTARGTVLLCEIKDGAKPPSQRALTSDELKVSLRWGASYVVVKSADEAIAVAKL